MHKYNDNIDCNDRMDYSQEAAEYLEQIFK